MTEDIEELLKKVIEDINKPIKPTGVGDSYLYQDDDGAIHMGDPKIGMHWMMSVEFYEALLKLKDLPPAKQYEQPKERVYKNVKPYYRKERW